MAVRHKSSAEGNWNEVLCWNPNTVPVADDDIVCAGGITQDITTGEADPLKFDSFVTTDDCTINVGTSGSPCKIQADKIDIKGRGNVYIVHDHDDGVTDLYTDHLIVRPANPEAIFVLTTVDGVADEVTLIEILSGDVSINLTGTIPHVYVGRRQSVSPKKVVLEATAGAVADLEIDYGHVIARNAVTMARVAAGALLTYTSGVMTECRVTGNLVYNSPNDLATLRARPGSVCDFTKVTSSDGGVITIANLYIAEGAKVLGLGDTVVATATHRMEGF